MNRRPKCSRCSCLINLHLITIPYEHNSESGRILLYCEGCRANAFDSTGVSIPIIEVTPEIFLDLYRTNKTASDPSTASEIVFGYSNARLVSAAEKLLDDRV